MLHSSGSVSMTGELQNNAVFQRALEKFVLPEMIIFSNLFHLWGK